MLTAGMWTQHVHWYVHGTGKAARTAVQHVVACRITVGGLHDVPEVPIKNGSHERLGEATITTGLISIELVRVRSMPDLGWHDGALNPGHLAKQTQRYFLLLARSRMR